LPFNGSGTFSLTYNWVTEQASSPIEISKLDGQESDIAAGLSNCILRDGTGVPTSATPWNSQNLTGVGSLTAVSGTFSGAVSATSTVTGSALVPSSSAVPTNGVYLPAANTVGVASNTTLRASVNSTGNWTFAAPSSGTALQVSSASGATGINVTEASVPKISLTSSVERAFFQYTESTSTARIDSDGILELASNNAARLSIASAGNLTANAPSSGNTLTINQVGSTPGIRITNGSGDLTFLATGGQSVINTPGAWGLDLQTNSSTRIGLAAAGNVTINAPSSGATLAINGLTGTVAFSSRLTGATNNPGLFVTHTESTSVTDLNASGSTSGSMTLSTAGTSRVSIGSSGNITVSAPSSGTTLAVTGVASGNAQTWTDGTETVYLTSLGAGNGYKFGTTTNHKLELYTNDTSRVVVAAAGNVTINAPSSGVALAVSGVSGTHSATISDAAATSGFKVGYLNIPQNAQTGNYTLVLADAGKHIYHAAGAGAGDTYTIPANGSVAYDIGTAITFINRDTTNAVSIAITTDTLTLAGTGSTGTRSLAAYGVATAIKVTSTEWMISGTGLS